MTSTTNLTSRRPRTQFWILLGIFFVPLALAFVLYYGVQDWRPGGSTNNGQLIDPPRPLPQAALTTPTGATLDANFMLGKWTLVYVGGGACDARCREALTLMRQTRLALGDDMTRVQRLFLAGAGCCDQAYLDEQHAGLITALTESAAGSELLRHFPADSTTAGRIYIVDPLGNLMMSYEPDARPKDLLEDLKKLLKLSHIG
jgi:cytochrome oxidase Cu insertion factor (SCO1/SenC/PrrC family)